MTYDADNQIDILPFHFSFSIIYVAVYAYLILTSATIFIYYKLIRFVKQMDTQITPANVFSRARCELKMVQRYRHIDSHPMSS